MVLCVSVSINNLRKEYGVASVLLGGPEKQLRSITAGKELVQNRLAQDAAVPTLPPAGPSTSPRCSPHPSTALPQLGEWGDSVWRMERGTQTPGWCQEFSASAVRNRTESPKAGQE